MHKFTKIMAWTLVLGVMAMGSLTSGPAVAAEGMAAIEKRVKFMKTDILKPFKAIKKFVKESKGSAAEVAENARKINAAAGKIAALFPKGTARGDYDEKTTRALPKIWQDWKGFEAAAASLAAESAKLATLASSGDAAAIGAQFGAMGKMGCGACHKSFRGAKVK